MRVDRERLQWPRVLYWLTGMLLACVSPAEAQLTRFERERALIMLDVVRGDVAKYYFDSTYGGVDLKTAFDSARVRIERAERIEQVFGALAVATLSLNDSHTAFVPPGLVYRAEYGWEMRFVGDTARVLGVKAGSDAASKGVRVGDAVLRVMGVPLTRQNIEQLKYSINLLQPRPSLRVTLSSPGAEPRELDVLSKVVQRSRVLDPNSSFDLYELITEGEKAWEEGATRYTVVEDRVLLWRVKGFHGDMSVIDELQKRLRNRESLILDLRGNGGGSINEMRRLIGQFYPQDFLIATELGRAGKTELLSDRAGKPAFKGALVVLVDAGSYSASEIVAKTIKLTGRGKVLGDRTGGAVRESRMYVHSVGTQTAAFYGANITVSDLLFPDGDRLENTGVIPDELILPAGEDLAAGRDPVLARALSLVGITRTPKEAGEIGREK